MANLVQPNLKFFNIYKYCQHNVLNTHTHAHACMQHTLGSYNTIELPLNKIRETTVSDNKNFTQKINIFFSITHNNSNNCLNSFKLQ